MNNGTNPPQKCPKFTRPASLPFCMIPRAPARPPSCLSSKNLWKTPDLHAVDSPIGIYKSTRVVAHVIDTGFGKLPTARLSPDITRPVTTEGDVKNNLVVFEGLRDITIASERSHWQTPSGRIRIAPNVSRNSVAWEPPDFNGRGGPLHGVHTTTGVVEAVTVRVGTLVFNVAACIVGLPWGPGMTVGCLYSSSER